MAGLNQFGSRIRSNKRRGMAALEVVMTTGITMIILGFACHWIIRICRVVFSLIGIMSGSPLV